MTFDTLKKINIKIGLITILLLGILIIFSFFLKIFKSKPEQQKQIQKQEIVNPLSKLREEGWTKDINQYVNYVRNNLLAKNLAIAKYKIKMGDNLWKIARTKRINIDTIVGVNPYLNDTKARLNQEILIISKKGVLHFIKRKEKIEQIALLYKKDKYLILTHNNSNIKEGKILFIPDAVPVDLTGEMADAYRLTEIFGWPLAIGGRYTSFMRFRIDPFNHLSKFHKGVDIKVPYGIGVCSSTPGVVTFAGWWGGYGKAVKIDYTAHGSKGKEYYEVIYGHNSKIYVRKGQNVKRGTLIARAGSTGRSTGTHLHFEVRKNGKPVDPMIFLWR